MTALRRAIFVVAALLMGAAIPGGGAVAAPFFGIDGLYSNADGSVQFIQMNTVESGALAGLTLVAYLHSLDSTSPIHAYTFPTDLPSPEINRLFLVATQGFADLGLVKPDYVIPNGFLFVPSGQIAIAGNIVPYSGLPTDGVNALWFDADGGPDAILPARFENFAGVRGDFASGPPAPPAPAVWVPTGKMNVARSGHTATLLRNGKVLVVGGTSTGSDHLDSAELYDPATGTWSLTGYMSVPRGSHTATLLADGRVLVAGGFAGATPAAFHFTNAAELYEPATGTWTQTGSMGTVRIAHTATLLQDGRVLVAGGLSQGPDKTAELYDPATGTWARTGNLNFARVRFTATLLQDGRVLAARGTNDTDSDGDAISTLSSAELYDPASGNWTPIASAIASSVDHTATLLPSGKVLVVGGSPNDFAGAALADSELFDPGTGTWMQTGSLASARSGHTATLLPNGNVLVAGGDATGRAAEQFDPIAATWSSVSSLKTARFGAIAALLPDGRVLVAGGSTASAELYGPPVDNSYRMTALFSDQAGVYQYIQLTNLSSSSGPNHFAGLSLTVTSRSGVVKRVHFPNDPGTASQSVCITTANMFASTDSDFVIPSQFMPTDGGTIDFAGIDTWTFGPLPSDGYSALYRNGTQQLASPSCSKFSSAGFWVITDPVIEYYNPSLDHYFISASQPDIDALDSGRIPGWLRTGNFFSVWTDPKCPNLPSLDTCPPPNLLPVCRLYIPPIKGDSHFFSVSPVECAGAQTQHPEFVLETQQAFMASLPDPQSGACQFHQTPVYRVWNGRFDSNHRYMLSIELRDQMVARGYIKEGYGPDAVAMCVGGEF